MARWARAVFLLLLTLVLTACPPPDSGGGDKQPDHPPYIIGEVKLPSGSSVDPSELTIHVGISGTHRPNSDGRYTLDLVTDNPVIATATTDTDRPVLMNLFDPSTATNDLNTETTAATMVFMGLGLYTGDAASFAKIRNTLLTLPEVEQLAQVLSDKIASDPNALSLDPPDQEIVNALDVAMDAASSNPNIVALVANRGAVQPKASQVIPDTQSGLTITVDGNNRAVATNEMLRFVRVTIDGPNASDIKTLVSPCSPPTLLWWPKKTILNPDPLSEPPAGINYNYEVRARGGLNNSNGLYDLSIDKKPLTDALCFSGFYNFILPLINVVLGTSSISDDAAIAFAIAAVNVFQLPFTTFATGVVDGGDLVRLSTQLLKDSLASFLSNLPGLVVPLSTYLATQVTETALANALGPVSVFFRVVSIAVNASKMMVGIYSLASTSMVDVYTISISSRGNSPLADFAANTTSITEGETVNFTDLSTNTPTSWSWNFGDAGTSTLQNPSHTYSTAGNYTVSLTATNAHGSDNETKSDYITVDPGTKTFVELKNDDGTAEGSMFSAGDCSGVARDLSDGNDGFAALFTPPSYPFKVQTVKIAFAAKNSENSGFYLHVRDELGNDLLPTPFIIPANDVNIGWWEKDISSFNITIDSGRIEVSIFESRLANVCGQPWSIYGWKIGYDNNSEGNSSFSVNAWNFNPLTLNLMIRTTGYLLSN